ncbi:MAG TPA: thioredoxin domain-containing protein [Acidobacteriaceae bacterium]
MSETLAPNALAASASAYLRSAMHQPIHWHEFGEEAFALAAREDKPVLLDIGAVWCHWCHVMDRESYENPALAVLINKHYIAVKVGRDERPDVDSRYQAAVSAMSGQGGWPLTALLMPDGRPFFGGTYFPPDDRFGRPGFARVLETMAGVWKERRKEITETAASVMAAIEHGESFAGSEGGGASLSPGLIDQLVGSALQSFDPQHGGFGSQPKFPHPAALDLLLDVAARTGSEQARHAATYTLQQMARGGIYDHLGGGFHRYSTDERWLVPHFEKMLYDNAGLLANYAHATRSFGGTPEGAEFSRITADILRWVDSTLSDRDQGGFYASQDADIHLNDDGDYFTWTRDEAAAVLTAEQLAIAEPFYDIGPLGDMHHNPARNVLHTRHTLASVAERAGIPLDRAEVLVGSAREALLAARGRRPTPFIDRTLYTGWNALAVTACLAAAEALSLEAPKAFALKTLDRMLAQAWHPERGLAHVVAYADGHEAARRVPGVLEDYAYLVHACLDAWQATAGMRYYQQAMLLADTMLARFYDETGDGFLDTEQVPGQPQTGVLSARRKPLQDAPTPAGNPSAADALLRLHALSGMEAYREHAEDTLEHFAGIVEHFGLYAGTYGLALERLLLPPVQVVVIGEGRQADELAAAALTPWSVNQVLLRLKPSQVRPELLPPVLAQTLPHLPLLDHGASFATLCRGNTCMPPITQPDELSAQLKGL